MGCITRNLAVIAVDGLFPRRHAPDEALGPEYREISEEESGLQFYAPGLKGGYRKFIYGQDERYVKRVVGVYGPKQGEFPRGQLVLIEMPPRLYFPRVSSPQDTIEDWEQFKERAITHGPEGTASTRSGASATRRSSPTSCPASSSGRFRHGLRYRRRRYKVDVGYYCKGETADDDRRRGGGDRQSRRAQKTWTDRTAGGWSELYR